MPFTSYAGSSFTVKVGATTYTAQITRGGITTTPNIVTTKTLGPNEADTKTNVDETATFDFLYDGASGFYSVLKDDADALTGFGLAVEITGGGGEWTGDMAVTDLGVEFDAENPSSCTASFKAQTGGLAFAASTP